MTITRFAPSPTGEPHLGNIRTALFAWLFARSQNGLFLLRIEDTDKQREVPGAVEKILESLEWLGIDVDNFQFPIFNFQSNHKSKILDSKFSNIIFQSQRLDIYKKYAEELVKAGHAYICNCSEERLQKLREEQIANHQPPMYDGHCRNFQFSIFNFQSPYVIRLKVPKEGQTTFNDLIKGQVIFENKLIDDQVLLKSDGYPTYHLANVIDDHLMGITDVIRAEEWLSSTAKHLLLYQFFGWTPPRFAHLPMILGKDKSKLSKRHGAISVLEYKKQGYLPEALVNYLALLGWNPGTDQEIFNREQLLKSFNLEQVQKSPAIFDQEKLDWMNGKYIRALSSEELVTKLVDFGKEYNEEIVTLLHCYIVKGKGERLVKLVQNRMNKLSDFEELTKFIVQLPDYDSLMLIFKNTPKEVIKKALESSLSVLENIDKKDFNQDKIKARLDKMIKAQGFKIGEVLHPLRVALAGLKNSPAPIEIAEVLGKEESLRRVRIGIEKL